MAINPLEFNDRVDFGNYKDVINKVNLNKTSVFVKSFSRWFGYRQQTLNQQYTLMGNKITNTKLIAIRHDPLVTEQMVAVINGMEYKVISISSDDRSARETFDLLTLQKVVK